MMAKMMRFFAGFMVCALLLGAYPIPAYGAEVPPVVEDNEELEGDNELEGTEEDTENSEENTESPEEDTEDAPIVEPEVEPWVIVLDPGHGGVDGGASRTINGVTYIERDLVLQIAYYCKAELEKYDNVVVYLTRWDNSSPSMDRQQRAYYAASVGADVLVSLHLNATNATTTYSYTGAEVYAPNTNYKGDISQAGCYLSYNILSELQAIGVPNNGIKFRNTEDNTRYPDGSEGDYLGINFWSKMYGFPGVLIEHTYINNPNDVANFLSTEQWLMALGAADARGIMNTILNGQHVYEKGFAGMWKQAANGLWWFEYATGGWPASQWLNLWGQWYYFDAQGYMVTGWQYWNNNWYYLGAPNDGVMKTGWQYINNQWYYFDTSGAMSSGWQWIGGNWYYLGMPYDGSMKTGWQYINGVWYYMYDAGHMASNTWIGKYYVDATGAWVLTR